MAKDAGLAGGVSPGAAGRELQLEIDELVEVTPRPIRIRKRFLDPHEPKREAWKLEAA